MLELFMPFLENGKKYVLDSFKPGLTQLPDERRVDPLRSIRGAGGSNAASVETPARFQPEVEGKKQPEASGRGSRSLSTAGDAHLSELESEAIYILREVAAGYKKPAILFSGGKDSICLLRLAEKAFYPSKPPFFLLHVDTGHNFAEVLDFRDRRVDELGARLIVASVEEAIEKGIARPVAGVASRNRLQSPTLLNAISQHNIDAAVGGARRDEEKARAKERIFSVRDSFGQWNPKRQRPELWRNFNTLVGSGEHMRVFPLSNWTELDVWQYILKENLEVPELYFSRSRKVVERDGQLLLASELEDLSLEEEIIESFVRVRTVGDVTCTGFFESGATTVEAIIEEVKRLRTTERGTRGDDRFSETAMEDRKKEGYF